MFPEHGHVHIKLKGMINAVTCKHIFCPNTPSAPGIGAKVKTFFFLLKVVMLHIKLMGMELRAPCKQIFCPYTHPQTQEGVKRSKDFFCTEISHVAYQIKGNGTQSTMQAHILSLHPQPLG